MKHTIWVLWLVALAGLTVACSSTPSTLGPAAGPRSWIDTPLDGSTWPPSPVMVISHSADPLRVVQVELSVNGQVAQVSPNPETGETLALTKQQWTPPGPGNYVLKVRAQNSTGVWGEYAQAVVTLLGAEAQPTQPMPTLPPPTPLVVPSATAARKPGGATPSPFPAATVTFYADATSLVLGKCTTLRWQVTNVSQVTLDNAAVNPAGSKQDCPTQTTTHTLRAATLDGQQVQRTLTIAVVAPTRTFTPIPTLIPTRTPTPVPVGCSGTPVISSFYASPSSIPLGSSSTLIWGAVMNADSVQIDNGIGGVPAPGSKTVSPSVTTGYVLTASCKGVTAVARTLVTVIQPPTPTLTLRRLPTATPTRTRIIVR